MIIFDNISSLILFKHEFTAPLVKCLFFFSFFLKFKPTFIIKCWSSRVSFFFGFKSESSADAT